MPISDLPAITSPHTLPGGATFIDACAYFKAVRRERFIPQQWVLVVVLAGKLTINQGSMEWSLAAGQAALLAPRSLLQFRSQPVADNYRSLLFFIPEEAFFTNDTPLRSNKLATTPLVEASFERVVTLPQLAMLNSYLESLHPYLLAGLEPLLGRLLAAKLSELVAIVQGLPGVDLFVASHQLQATQYPGIVEVVQKYMYTPLTLSELAALANRSLASFKRDFAQVYCAPPAEWLRHRRLDMAVGLLRKGRLSVAEVGFAAGFESPASFTRAFRRRYGHTPSKAAVAQAFSTQSAA